MKRLVAITFAVIVLALVSLAAKATQRVSVMDSSGFYINETGDLSLVTLKVQLPDANRVTVDGTEKLLSGVESVLSRGSSTLLVSRKHDNHSHEIWLVDTKTKETRRLSADASMATLSPNGQLAALTTRNKLILANAKGELIESIGTHAGSAVFSHSSRLLAYMKLADDRSNLYIDSPGRFQGIYVYDLIAGEERLVLQARDGDYGVSAWSPDDSRIYFVSSKNDYREGETASTMWSVKMDGSDVRQETNTSPGAEFVPPLYSGSIWMPSRRLVISDGDGIWFYRLGHDYKILEAKQVSGDGQLQWVDSKMLRLGLYSKGTWKVVDISKLR